MFSARSCSMGESQSDAQPGGVNRQIVRALFNLIFAALLLRIGGMINQVVLSATFGVGGAMDAYFVATAFPLLLIQLISSALEAAVIPVYSRVRTRASQADTSRLTSTLINGLAMCALFLTCVLILLRQPLVMLSAPGLDVLRMRQAFALAPWLYLVIPLSLVISLLEALLNAEGQFGWPAYAALLVPCATVLVTILGVKIWGIQVLCIGLLSGTLMQFIVVGIRARRARLRYRLVVDLGSPELGGICRAAWPVLLGALIIQSGPLVDQIFASILPAGTISALNYALKLLSVFTGVIVVSLGRVALPHLARQVAQNDSGYQAFKQSLHLYLWSIGSGSLLLSGCLCLGAYPLIHLLFQHGAFSASDAHMTALIFFGFIPGLTPIALNFLLSRAFNALGEMRIPMYMALVNVGANAFFDALFAHFWGGPGIALATSTVSFIVCLLFLTLLYWRIGPFQFWSLPSELRVEVTRLGLYLRRSPYWLKTKQGLISIFTHLRCIWLYIGITIAVLSVGVIATVRDAIGALRISVGALLFINLWRYPFVLLLAWASLNVGIGSSLPGFNGNNLDLILILPVLGLLACAPWQQCFMRMPGLIWLAGYLLWVFLGIGLSPLTTTAFLTLWLTMLASIGVGVLTLALVSTRQRFSLLIDVLLGTGLLTAFYGWYGLLTHQHGERDPATALFRVTSLFTQATTFAFYLSSLLPLGCYRCLYTRGCRRVFNVGITSCLSGALALTFTRSACIGVLGGMLIMALCLPGSRTRFLVIGGLLAGSGALFYLAWYMHLPWLARFFEGDIATLNGRLYLWQALLNNFQVTRWLGSGLESSDQLLAYLQVGAAGQGVIGTAPHSLFLGTLYDHGVIGLSCLCLALYCFARDLWRGIWRSHGEQRMLYGAALACLFSVLIQSVGSRDLWIQAAGTPFWIVIALPFACYWIEKEKAPVVLQNARHLFSVKMALVPDFLVLCQTDERVEGEV